MKIFVINGPNLNMLGIRETEIYGDRDYVNLCNYIDCCSKELGLNTIIFQSNHEGDIVDFIQKAYYEGADGIVINPAGYTHTSVAICDAIKSVSIPTIEVHLSDIGKRESFRKVSLISPACIKTISGLGFEGYKEAIKYLMNYILNKQEK